MTRTAFHTDGKYYTIKMSVNSIKFHNLHIKLTSKSYPHTWLINADDAMNNIL